MWKEFKEFAIKGSALDLAVGVVIGAAFSQVVNSLVNDILNPIIGIFSGHVYFTSMKLVIFHHVIGLGNFINSLINFLIVAFAIFLIVKQFNRFRTQSAPSQKTCPYCQTNIPINAVRCPNCTSDLK
jgi:large conductance mechanosensitive channel